MVLVRRTTGTTTTFWIARRGDDGQAPLDLRPTPVTTADGSQIRFQLWAALTEPLFDAYGRRGPERFVDLCPVVGGVLQLPTGPFPAKCPPTVRLVEVQVLPGQEQVLIDAAKKATAGVLSAVRHFFFPDDPQDRTEAQARSVRVSSAIIDVYDVQGP
jgi:hypothetical protein